MLIKKGEAIPEAPHALYYLGIFTALCFLEAALVLAMAVLYAWGAWRAAGRLHAALVNAVLGAPLAWHSVTPAGRIVNRFSRDVESLDVELSKTVMATCRLLVQTLVRLGAVSVVLPAFIAPALIFGALGSLAGELYTRAAVPVKRLLSASQSPVVSLLDDTLAGLAVIRASRPRPRIEEAEHPSASEGVEGEDAVQGASAMFTVFSPTASGIIREPWRRTTT